MEASRGLKDEDEEEEGNGQANSPSLQTHQRCVNHNKRPNSPGVLNPRATKGIRKDAMKEVLSIIHDELRYKLTECLNEAQCNCMADNDLTDDMLETIDRTDNDVHAYVDNIIDQVLLPALDEYFESPNKEFTLDKTFDDYSEESDEY